MLILLFLPFLLSFKLLDVPFVKQRDQFCGPASLSSVFAYYGIEISQEEIAKEVYDPRLKGALITDLESYAKRKGFKTLLKEGNLQELKETIDKGIPPIVLVDLGYLWVSVPHYMVVVGYDGDLFFVHTGYEERKKFHSKELDRIWKKMGKPMLLIYR